MKDWVDAGSSLTPRFMKVPDGRVDYARERPFLAASASAVNLR